MVGQHAVYVATVVTYNLSMSLFPITVDDRQYICLGYAAWCKLLFSLVLCTGYEYV